MDSDNWRVKRNPSEVPATPNHSFNQRQPGGFDDSQRGSRGRRGGGGHRSSPANANWTSTPPSSRESMRKSLSKSEADQAVEEGRRLYVGNLPYEATVNDIESLFEGVDGVQGINMSVDPMTGRNPSYCFVDFESANLAARVIEEFNGREFLRRSLKVKPGTKSGTGKGRFDIRNSDRQREGGGASPFAYDRWKRLDTTEEANLASQTGRRLWVGGLPMFRTQVETNKQIRELFEGEGFHVEVVSKRHPPHESKKGEPGNHHYCYVDLGSAEEVALACKTLDGLNKWNGSIKVRLSNSTSSRVGERRRLFVGGLPELPDEVATTAAVKELFEGFMVETISKLFFPKDESRMNEGGNHCHCFVQLSSEEETDKAMLELDCKELWGGTVRVKAANSAAMDARRDARGWRLGWDPLKH